MDKKIGLFIKTYSNDKTSNIRIEIIEELFISLKNNVESNIIKILIVDNCNTYHKQIIDKYSNIFNEIIYNSKNKGISACQNIGIRHLIYKYDIDIGFGCDDDIIIHKNGLNRYIDTIIKTNIHHFCYYPFKEYVKLNFINPNLEIQQIYKDNILELKDGISGCFFTFTKEMIKNIGYFPKLSYNYGYEHEIFTFNYLEKKHSLDIISNNSQISNLEKNIELNIKSTSNTSMSSYDHNELIQNKIESENYKKKLGQYIPYYDASEFIQIIIFYEEENIDNIINNILLSLYLNFMIIIVNKNKNNIDKFQNKLYIKIIENIDDFISKCINKTYILNKKININNNNIYLVNNLNQINELKEKRNIKYIISINLNNNLEIIINKNTNLFDIQNKINETNKKIDLKIDKNSFGNNLKEIRTFVKCMKKGYFYGNSNIKINNKMKIDYI